MQVNALESSLVTVLVRLRCVDHFGFEFRLDYLAEVMPPAHDVVMLH
jgi:hypothetical protein